MFESARRNEIAMLNQSVGCSSPVWSVNWPHRGDSYAQASPHLPLSLSSSRSAWLSTCPAALTCPPATVPPRSSTTCESYSGTLSHSTCSASLTLQPLRVSWKTQELIKNQQLRKEHSWRWWRPAPSELLNMLLRVIGDCHIQLNCAGDFPGGPVAKATRSPCRGPGFDPWSGNQISHAATKSQHNQINIFKNNKNK